jgi:hypothetical protein
MRGSAYRRAALNAHPVISQLKRGAERPALFCLTIVHHERARNDAGAHQTLS